MKHTHQFLYLLFTLGLLWGLAPTSVAQAATIDVNTTDDELNSDGDCSLREAIRAANTNTAVDACPAGSTGDDIINIPAGTYTLTLTGISEDAAATGDLDITDADGSLTINGENPATTIVDGNDTDRVFDVHEVGSGITFTINNLTITNGRATDDDGGGIRIMSAFVTLNNVIISNNEVFGGTLLDGGGLYYEDNNSLAVDSYVRINHSSIINNHSVDRGGGIYGVGADQTTIIRNSTISGNTSDDDGAGIRFNSSSAIALIENSTIANNTAADNAGGLSMTGPLAVTNIQIKNSIIADNINNGIGGQDCNTNGSPMTVSYSLIEDATDCTLGGSSGNNVIGSDPNLAALNIASTFLPTHALQSPSLAIDSGHTQAGGTAAGGCLDNNNALLNTDQRGGARAQGINRGDSGCDMGAYEFNSSETPTAVTNLHTQTNPPATTSLLPLLLTTLLATLTSAYLWARRPRRSTF